MSLSPHAEEPMSEINKPFVPEQWSLPAFVFLLCSLHIYTCVYVYILCERGNSGSKSDSLEKIEKLCN